MKTIFQNRWLLFSLRLILGVIFVVASIAKIQDIAKFVSIVTSYGILPDSLAHLYGYVAPWAELFIGCALILGVFVQFSTALLIPLILSFMVASSYELVNTVRGSCGCFGKFLTLSHPVALTIDVLMLIASIILLLNKGQAFLSIGQLIERFRIKPRTLGIGLRLASVVLLMTIVAVISIGIRNVSKHDYNVIETINIPVSVANDVDNALSNGEPVLMEFYIDGCHLCQLAAPIISDMEKEFINKTVFIRIDYKQYLQNQQVVPDLDITNIPSVRVIVGKNSDGKYEVLCRFEGTVEREALRACLEKAINYQSPAHLR
jgi:uncharacterized membrane protein YphA (DoxX/SURF4 family)/thiol-disulfide isomerase/thioredoxin